MKLRIFILGLFLGIILGEASTDSLSVKEFSIEQGSDKPLEGSNVTFVCLGIGSEIHWQHRKHFITTDTSKRKVVAHKQYNDDEGMIIGKLHLINVSQKDNGRYRCIIRKEDKKVDRTLSLHIQVPPELQEIKNYTGPLGSTAVLSCTCKAIPKPVIQWLRNKTQISTTNKYAFNNKTEGNFHISQLLITNIDEKDIGDYQCQFSNSHGSITANVSIVIQELPEIEFIIARSLGPQEIQLHWLVNRHDAPLTSTNIYVVKEGQSEIVISIEPMSTTSVLLGKKELKIIEHPEESAPMLIQIVVEVTNDAGAAETEVANITMLKTKPYFKPEGFFRGSTKDSLTVAWTQPDEQLQQFIDVFKLSLINNETGDTMDILLDAQTQDNLFTSLIDGTYYKFTVSACMKFPDEKLKCGPPSRPVSGRTLSEPPSPVSDVIVYCESNRTSGINKVYVRWEPNKDGKSVNRYKVDLKASANFIDKDGRPDFYNNITHAIVSGDLRHYIFNNVHPNTNYTVKVYAVNKHVSSQAVVFNCETPIWMPTPQHWKWWKFSHVDSKKIILKMPIPKVSQRNGTICCMRVIVVHIKGNKSLTDLPAPREMPILSYTDAENLKQPSGYVAEVFISSGVNKSTKYLLVGDGEVLGNWSSECARCLGTNIPISAATREMIDDINDGVETYKSATGSGILPYTKELRKISKLSSLAEDGFLHKDENYTGYFIMSVRDENGTVLHSYSDFFNVVEANANSNVHSLTTPTVDSPLTRIVYVLGASIILLALMALILGFLLCHYHKKRKQLIDEGNDESLTGSLGRRIFRTLRRSHTLMSQPGIDVKPIPKDELVEEYLDKIKDSELGFRREFEALPEKFYDRSSRASELSENSIKNRYPDIKAYDQTRVKLHQLNGIVGSNYINANFVLGYKERKKFICAQGPMESTVNEFWRMIVEQRSSLCIMLTNLEENGKLKCVKYWPEAGEPKTYGKITVRLVKEKPFADYVVRTLRAEWTVVTSVNSAKDSSNDNSTNSTSVENGVINSGTATIKSNSSITNSNNSNYNSLSSNSVTTSEETKFHEVQQYHYLVWKDFVAPEHPVALLSFLRRINAAYSTDLGPLLIHCSAGVGRTGTLVALDALIMELDEEQQASIFNIICDLRHQRNFLVQSLKQYVFVHRALMEQAQFGNSEQSIFKLKENYIRQGTRVSVDEPSELEREFKRLSKVIEDRKAFTVANSETNRNKNRYDYILPYDTNCVILTPLPNAIGATYINASFMTGFDLGENFIVTQDPLQNTISDFWRMTYEQEVNTIVMISEHGSGEGCCSKYWPDEEEIHEYITVKFISSESYPKYSMRMFLITNNKNGDARTVTQFQYVGWSGLTGEVPLATLGIMEVIARVQSHTDINLSHISPTLIHCSGGGDRSSVYVCLSNCLRQLRREGCVDVFQIARKIRSQRQFQLQEYAQYDFVYKALVEYVDMKKGENL